ncbi:hypothetical protein EGI11_03345 [Chryseobacterium sp. H3056]|uniref:Uncharacterized protein n=1 Tax=Kaistella daneshvariae TaxID=2487074 RepID=A0A3N0WXJ6_9FLAO|nr:hypothetical protein [Kaistella daneshvariae]ROI09806.1 hypothetical protein EGI11_03345 [Kaistella daneshvariae]
MKTTINLEDYDFGKARLVHQIDDDAATGFARVLLVWGAEINGRADFIKIDAEILHLNNGKIVKQMSIYPALNGGKPWIIENDNMVVSLDSNLNAIPNPDFNSEEEMSEENFPYLKSLAFEMYADKCFEALSPLLTKGIDNDNNNGMFE